MKKIALHNLGCKVNAYETDAMQELLEQAGYEIVPFEPGADVYLINTCTVTNIADRKSRQMLHRAHKMNPEAIVIACGCYVQAQEEAGHPVDSCIDIVIGNNNKKDIVTILKAYEESHTYSNEEERNVVKEIIDVNHTKEYETLSLSKTVEHTRAYIKVQDGCNQFCTYCIIPFARGRVRSRRPENVVEEVRALAKNGYKEIVLTGIHLSSYGFDFSKDEYEKMNLLTLIKAVHAVEGIQRIRLGSLEPRIITEEFAFELSRLPKLCPHFHLSLQSGCDATLKRMNRRYTSDEYYEKCQILRKYFPMPALTTDVITGFPGETEEEFEQSLAFVDKVHFYETHIFKYSRREGTKAAAMKEQLTEAVKTERSARMLELNERRIREYESSFLGKEVEVLFEEAVEKDGCMYQIGHTREYIRVVLKSEENLQNTIRTIPSLDSAQIYH